MGGGLESRCVGRVYGADGARHHDDGRMYPKTCRAKNTSIKLPSCIKLAFHFITRGRCTVKQPSRIYQDARSSEFQNIKLRLII